MESKGRARGDRQGAVFAVHLAGAYALPGERPGERALVPGQARSADRQAAQEGDRGDAAVERGRLLA